MLFITTRTLTRNAALGVGIKAVPALTSPSELDDDEGASPRQAVYMNSKDSISRPSHSPTHLRSSGQFNLSCSSSALHSIMEQGTLRFLGLHDTWLIRHVQAAW